MIAVLAALCICLFQAGSMYCGFHEIHQEDLHVDVILL